MITEGEWIQQDLEIYAVSEGKSVRICRLDIPKEWKENGLLINSAPKLLRACKGDALDEALRELDSELPNYTKVKRLIKYKKQQIEQAISSAEGK